jgi:transcriptional regulator with XRE-family HTH domain
MKPSDVHPDSRILLKTLRDVLKAKKQTYGQLAKKLHVSEVTIKRWFTGQTCALESIFKICEILEISFFDLAALARQEEEVDYVLTREQELFFSKNPAFFGIFKQLQRGVLPRTIAETWRLNSPKLHSVLRSLEKQRLLEVLPHDRVRIKVRGNIRYGHQGPLAKAILRPQIEQFLDHVDTTIKDDDVCMHSAEVELSLAHINEFVEELHSIGAKYRARAFRDQSLLPLDKLKSVRWLLGFAPYETNWRQYKL